MVILGYTHFQGDAHEAAEALRSQMLFDVLGIQSAVIHRAEGGKPYLADWLQIHHSISHTGCLVICVLSFPGVRETTGGYTVLIPGEEAPIVGVDGEYLRPVEEAPRLRRIARRFCPSEDADRLDDLGDEAVPLAFAEIWTRCESLVKMTGEGLRGGVSNRPLPKGECTCMSLRRSGQIYVITVAIEADTLKE